jgi:hypothetical protein
VSKDMEVPASGNAVVSVTLARAAGGGKRPEIEF